ncbi:MAG: RagB/SusD family nutrient uptake outer membrane protein [Chitinophagales bacterium]|nr:RagB/SusD family nutrient uptake outer membrane protein [Chitinophagales bacterium]MDW8394217.1 RagB/SusD family nutrient uptake outer membrane protein [Chitinophagales bacterium]
MKKFAFWLIVPTLLSSCESFLDLTPPDDVADDAVLTSADGLISARIGMYNALQQDAYYGGFFPLMIDAYSDNGAAGGYDAPQLNQFNEKNLGADNIFIDNLWVAAYQVIYTANRILAQIDGIADPALSDELRADIKGEALAVRALAHFDLLRTFGEHWDVTSSFGIPLMTEADDPMVPKGRATVAACYQRITDDLQLARQLISNEDLVYGTGLKSAAFLTPHAVAALQARVALYQKDYAAAKQFASEVINSGGYQLLEDPVRIYRERLTPESIFELQFTTQDQSQYNNLTYVRDDALRVDVYFLANRLLNDFFNARPGDLRAQLVNFDPAANDGSIQPDGRTQKYRGEESRDNPAFILRLAELYLIRAEASAMLGDLTTCQNDLQVLASVRGSTLPPIGADNFMDIVQEERRAELNFEGHRYFDLARIGKVAEVIGQQVLPVFPIPINQLLASGGLIQQYPGY